MGKVINFYIPEHKPISMNEFNKPTKVTHLPPTTQGNIPVVIAEEGDVSAIKLLETVIKEEGEKIDSAVVVMLYKDGTMNVQANCGGVAEVEQLLHRMLYCMMQVFWQQYDNPAPPSIA